MENKYYVYIAKYNGEIVYIGKGKDKRYLHINSGCSHVYEANRLHHVHGVVFEVEIIKKGISMEKASEIEVLMIRTYSPIWNKQFTHNDNRQRNMRAIRDIQKRLDSDFKLNFSNTKYIMAVKLSKQLSEILYRLNSGEILRKVFEKLHPQYKPMFSRFENNGIFVGTFVEDLLVFSKDSDNRRVIGLSELGFEYIRQHLTSSPQ